MPMHASTTTSGAGTTVGQTAKIQSQTAQRTPEAKLRLKAAAKLRHVEKLDEARRTLQAANDSSMTVKWLRIEELEILLKRSRASIYRDVIAKRLPAPLKMGERCARWNRVDVEAALIGGGV